VWMVRGRLSRAVAGWPLRRTTAWAATTCCTNDLSSLMRRKYPKRRVVLQPEADPTTTIREALSEQVSRPDNARRVGRYSVCHS
jgi:hypothetical protein